LRRPPLAIAVARSATGEALDRQKRFSGSFNGCLRRHRLKPHPPAETPDKARRRSGCRRRAGEISGPKMLDKSCGMPKAEDDSTKPAS